jgi:hypothetical protein
MLILNHLVRRKVLDVLIIAFVLAVKKPAHVREPKTFFDIVRVIFGVRIAVVIPMTGRPVYSRTLESGGPKKKIQKNQNRMGLESPVREKTVIAQRRTEHRNSGHERKKNPIRGLQTDKVSVNRQANKSDNCRGSKKQHIPPHKTFFNLNHLFSFEDASIVPRARQNIAPFL